MEECWNEASDWLSPCLTVLIMTMSTWESGRLVMGLKLFIHGGLEWGNSGLELMKVSQTSLTSPFPLFPPLI